VPSRYELEPEETPRYWQKFSGDGKQRESKATAMRQLKARAKAGDIDALQELQEIVMASLMTELDSEPDEAPRTSRSEASRRAVYAEHSPPPRSSVRPIRLPPPPSHETSAKRPDILKMTIKGIDVGPKSLKGGADRAGVQFATKGSEVYTAGMCKMIAELAQEYTRQLLSTAIKSSKQMAHQVELRIDAHGSTAQDANTSLVKASEYGWRPKTSKALLDSCADAHIWIDIKMRISR
jgi:hypothetical protein